jgi:hypothetical protein
MGEAVSRTFLLQDWTTIRGAAALASLVQDEGRWLDLDGFSDATCWIDVAEITPPGGTSTNYLTLSLETAAVCDDAYFTPMMPNVSFGTAAPFNQASPSPLVLRSTRSLSSANLMRYVRWKITPNTGALWDLTFRIRIVATRSSAFVPTDIAGCNLWLRSDLGVSVTPAATTISSWKDQSGQGNDATPGISPTYVMNGVNGLPLVRVASGQYLAGALQGGGVSAHTLFTVVSYPTPLGNYAAFASTTAGHGVNTGFSQFTETPTGIVGRTGDGTGVSFTTASTSTTSSLGALGIYSTAASTGGSVDIWVNGVSKASVANPLTLPSSPNYLLFTLSVPTQYNFVGDAYELILFNSVLSAANRTRIHRYLGARYNIAVP